MTQVLPPNESFAAPDWLTPTSGTTTSHPWYFWYIGFIPGVGVDAAAYLAWPYHEPWCPTPPPVCVPKGGALDSTLGQLYIPSGGTPSPFPALMTGPYAGGGGGIGAYRSRCVLCREEDSVAVEDIDYKVVFGLQSMCKPNVGVSTSSPGGGFNKGSGGGGYTYPSTPETSGDEFNDMAIPAGGTWQAGGGPGGNATTAPLWTIWVGNSLFFRAGGGFPDVYGPGGGMPDFRVVSVRQGPDHYAFTVYPVINAGTSAVDLYLELWECHWTGAYAAGDSGVPRRLAQQIVAVGASKIDFTQPYFLRVICDNNGAGNVEMQAFIGAYTNHLGLQAEVQCFKVDELSSGTPTVTVTSGVTADTVNGIITDANANKIATYADKTFGWSMGRDRAMDVADKLFASTPRLTWGIEGVYSVEVKDVSAGSVLYRDEFLRCTSGPTPLTPTGDTIMNPVYGQFGQLGGQAGGLFTFDGYANQYSVGQASIRRLMLQTDDPHDHTGPNDFVTLDYDEEDGAGDSALYNVPRMFVHERPSTQYYNHHRSIEFKPGAEYANSSYCFYHFGLGQRGSFDGRAMNGLTCYLYWDTDGSGSSLSTHIRYVSLTISDWKGLYNTQSQSRTPLARKEWSTPSELLLWNNGGSYDLYDGSFHKLDFRAEIYSAASSPQAAAEYLVEFDGNPIQFDDTKLPLVSSTVSPYPVIHPGPLHYAGNSEGFFFMGLPGEYGLPASPTQNYAPVQARLWTEGALNADPGPGSDDNMASISVGGEGTPVGALNTSAGALGITGSGVFEVETTVSLDEVYPIRRVRFGSGHTYTSPGTSKARRRWRVQVAAAPLAVFQALQAFFNSHSGMEVPFSFVVPIPDDGTGAGTAESTETVNGWFSDDTLQVSEVGPEVYDIAFSVEELLVP